MRKSEEGQKVYLLFHHRPFEFDGASKDLVSQADFFLGAFDSYKKAKEAIGYYLTISGFRKYTEEEFYIHKLEVDRRYIPAAIIMGGY